MINRSRGDVVVTPLDADGRPRLADRRVLPNVEITMRLDQSPSSVTDDGPRIHDLVAEDVYDRMLVGVERYGTPLSPRDGRDVLWEAYEDALDLVVSLRQAIWDRDHRDERT